MKRFFLAAILSLAVIRICFCAEIIKCSTDYCAMGIIADECNNTCIKGCATFSDLLPNSYGIVKNTTRKLEWTCPDSNNPTGAITCKCVDESYTYSCGQGYYGSATSDSTGCIACPSNATCNGGNGSTFLCNGGYYKSGTGCIACPSNATCNGGDSSTFSCNGGYYKSGAACANCAANTGHPSATSLAGAAMINGCYLPAGTTGNDTSGSFAYTSNCFYKIGL
ncbi:MAG: hypothetical protein LBD50_03390 [Rickettsiales bacterium]|nr:hypothetical protein [Rickettsiales bacterium]